MYQRRYQMNYDKINLKNYLHINNHKSKKKVDYVS
jgi:hypothetical protein